MYRITPQRCVLNLNLWHIPCPITPPKKAAIKSYLTVCTISTEYCVTKYHKEMCQFLFMVQI